jgi:hypothetical protein
MALATLQVRSPAQTLSSSLSLIGAWPGPGRDPDPIWTRCVVDLSGLDLDVCCYESVMSGRPHLCKVGPALASLRLNPKAQTLNPRSLGLSSSMLFSSLQSRWHLHEKD